ncbi:MAG TPA: hypothetical protein VFV87_05350 [Pirellulaceae bacterium]|nr:hypothetical protein [Pirellulaceae bacterium]
MSNAPPLVPNTLGKASLVLGILASTLVVSVGLCAGVGQQQGWLKQAGPLLFIVGGTFAFLGIVSALLGIGGLFGRHRSRATSIFGLILGLIAVAIFLAVVSAANR